MPSRPESGRGADSAVLVFLFGLLLFCSPLTLWWAAVAAAWYLPYVLWLALIALIAWAAPRSLHDV